MDVSSKYFALLKTPGPDVIKHIWHFCRDIRRVGKVRELVSFIIWEISHRLYVYRICNQYIQFTDHIGLSISNQSTTLANSTLTSSFLTEHNLCLRAITIDWKFCLQTTEGLLWGSRFSHTNALYCSENQSQSAALVYEFDYPISSLFSTRQNVLFVCSKGSVYKSEDRGRSFKQVLRFSSPISYFLFNNGMTQLPDGTLLIGEYGSIWKEQTWQNLAYLYSSTDGGNTWEVSDFLIRQGVNKHIHLVKYSSLLKAVLLTDGDNKKQVWMNPNVEGFKDKAAFQENDWRLLNQYHHQMGGYMAMTETNESVLLGSDYLGGTNFIVKTTDGKRFEKRVLPDPYRRSPVMNMVNRQSDAETEIWAASYSCLAENARSLLMCTKDGGKTWNRVLDFDGTRYEVRFVNSFQPSSAELYLSVTKFGSTPDHHRHRIYKLERHS